jgi:hypothetical protein
MVWLWLEREDNMNWCLVLDGINDINAMPEPSKVLPSCEHGHIIITSRDTTVSDNDYVRASKVVSVGELGIESGVELLLKS